MNKKQEIKKLENLYKEKYKEYKEYGLGYEELNELTKQIGYLKNNTSPERIVCDKEGHIFPNPFMGFLHPFTNPKCSRCETEEY
jgi:hypothetical protein